jgi:CBS domain-containing protein
VERWAALKLQTPLRGLVRAETVEVAPNEPWRAAVYRTAEKGFTRMPVVERETRKFLGLISLDDLLKGRSRHIEEERRRERPLRLEFLFGAKKWKTSIQPPWRAEARAARNIWPTNRRTDKLAVCLRCRGGGFHRANGSHF